MSTEPEIVLGFAARQTPKSRFSHFEGIDLADGWADFVARIRRNWHRMRPTYRAYNKETGKCDKYGLPFGGVIEIPIDDVSGFFSGVAKLEAGDKLVGVYEARKAGEEPRKNTCVAGRTKLPAKTVNIILYHADVLAEEEGHKILGEWEVVSINTSPDEGEIPIEPMTLLHNHFGSSGGTATGMTDSELVAALRKSFDYWKDKAFVAGE